MVKDFCRPVRPVARVGHAAAMPLPGRIGYDQRVHRVETHREVPVMKDEDHSWSMRRLRKWLNNWPESRDELLNLVQHSRQFLEPQTADMLEGVLSLSAISLREIMTPRPSIIGLFDDDELLEILPVLIDSAHSRFPVFSSEDRETVTGVLMAKDMLKVLMSPQQRFDIKAHVRPVLFVPETARADQLLSQLQLSQSHLAVVMDEFGHTAGLVTLEDLLEEIVGEIEDEYDNANEKSALIQPDPAHPGCFLLDARTPIDAFNDQFDTTLVGDGVETLAGLLLAELGRVSNLVGQSVTLEDWTFTVLQADQRSLQQLRACRRAD